MNSYKTVKRLNCSLNNVVKMKNEFHIGYITVYPYYVKDYNYLNIKPDSLCTI